MSSDTVEAYCRVRRPPPPPGRPSPSSSSSASASSPFDIRASTATIRVHPPNSSGSPAAGSRRAQRGGGTTTTTTNSGGARQPKDYTFEAVFDAGTSQADVYRRCAAPLVQEAVLEGMNGTILCCGPRGSGKTLTAFGGRPDLNKNSRSNARGTVSAQGGQQSTGGRDAGVLAASSGNYSGSSTSNAASRFFHDVQSRNDTYSSGNGAGGAAGGAAAGDSSDGIVPRALHHIFEGVRVLANSRQYSVSLTILEFVGDNVTDLLAHVPSPRHTGASAAATGGVPAGFVPPSSGGSVSGSHRPHPSGVNGRYHNSADASADGAAAAAQAKPLITLDAHGKLVLKNIRRVACPTEAAARSLLASAALFSDASSSSSSSSRLGNNNNAHSNAASSPGGRPARAPAGFTTLTSGNNNNSNSGGGGGGAECVRGHVVVSIHVTCRDAAEGEEDTGEMLLGLLHVVDLAGRQLLDGSGGGGSAGGAMGRSQDTAASSSPYSGAASLASPGTGNHSAATSAMSPAERAAAKQINRSLFTLEQVIAALGNRSGGGGGGRSDIPYRQSKLTTYLKDCLGGRARTAVIAHIIDAPVNTATAAATAADASFEGSMAALALASRLGRVTVSAAVNTEIDPVKHAKYLEREVQNLRAELRLQLQLSNNNNNNQQQQQQQRGGSLHSATGGSEGAAAGDEYADVRGRVAGYLSGSAATLRVGSTREMQAAFSLLREAAEEKDGEAAQLRREVAALRAALMIRRESLTPTAGGNSPTNHNGGGGNGKRGRSVSGAAVTSTSSRRNTSTRRSTSAQRKSSTHNSSNSSKRQRASSAHNGSSNNNNNNNDEDTEDAIDAILSSLLDARGNGKNGAASTRGVSVLPPTKEGECTPSRLDSRGGISRGSANRAARFTSHVAVASSHPQQANGDGTSCPSYSNRQFYYDVPDNASGGGSSNNTASAERQSKEKGRSGGRPSLSPKQLSLPSSEVVEAPQSSYYNEVTAQREGSRSPSPLSPVDNNNSNNDNNNNNNKTVNNQDSHFERDHDRATLPPSSAPASPSSSNRLRNDVGKGSNHKQVEAASGTQLELNSSKNITNHNNKNPHSPVLSAPPPLYPNSSATAAARDYNSYGSPADFTNTPTSYGTPAAVATLSCSPPLAARRPTTNPAVFGSSLSGFTAFTPHSPINSTQHHRGGSPPQSNNRYTYNNNNTTTTTNTIVSSSNRAGDRATPNSVFITSMHGGSRSISPLYPGSGGGGGNDRNVYQSLRHKNNNNNNDSSASPSAQSSVSRSSFPQQQQQQQQHDSSSSFSPPPASAAAAAPPPPPLSGLTRDEAFEVFKRTAGAARQMALLEEGRQEAAAEEMQLRAVRQRLSALRAEHQVAFSPSASTTVGAAAAAAAAGGARAGSDGAAAAATAAAAAGGGGGVGESRSDESADGSGGGGNGPNDNPTGNTRHNGNEKEIEDVRETFVPSRANRPNSASPSMYNNTRGKNTRHSNMQNADFIAAAAALGRPATADANLPSSTRRSNSTNNNNNNINNSSNATLPYARTVDGGDAVVVGILHTGGSGGGRRTDSGASTPNPSSSSLLLNGTSGAASPLSSAARASVLALVRERRSLEAQAREAEARLGRARDCVRQRERALLGSFEGWLSANATARV